MRSAASTTRSSKKNSFGAPIRVISQFVGQLRRVRSHRSGQHRQLRGLQERHRQRVRRRQRRPRREHAQPVCAGAVGDLGRRRRQGRHAGRISPRAASAARAARFTMPDGANWTYTNEPTVVATGVDIVSTRALTGALPAAGGAGTTPNARRPPPAVLHPHERHLDGDAARGRHRRAAVRGESRA